MSKVDIRRNVLTLRGEGKSYSQIKAEFNVSKSTLSRWLKGKPLTKEQVRQLRDVNQVRIERYRATMLRKKTEKLNNYLNEEKAKWLPLSKRELYIAGLFLYWGEGSKADNYNVSLNNTDPSVVRFALYWLIHSLGVPKKDIKVFLHLYSDMNVEAELEYWAKELNMPRINFNKPYIKISKRIDIDQKGYGHGTCGVRAYGGDIKRRVIKGIEAISDYYVHQGDF